MKMNKEQLISPIDSLIEFKKSKMYIISEKINQALEDLTDEEYEKLVEEINFTLFGKVHNLSHSQIEQLEKALNTELIKV